MPALPDERPSPPPSSGGVALVAPVVVLALALWTLLGSWNRSLFGWQVGAPFTRGLEAVLGAEGVQPGRDLLGRVSFLMLLTSIVWWIALRRAHWRPPEPHVQEMVLDLKAATTTLLVFLVGLGATTVFLVHNLFGGPGTWLDETFGPPALGYWGVAGLALLTAIFGLALRSAHRRLRHHPVYGIEPRR